MPGFQGQTKEIWSTADHSTPFRHQLQGTTGVSKSVVPKATGLCAPRSTHRVVLSRIVLLSTLPDQMHVLPELTSREQHTARVRLCPRARLRWEIQACIKRLEGAPLLSVPITGNCMVCQGNGRCNRDCTQKTCSLHPPSCRAPVRFPWQMAKNPRMMCLRMLWGYNGVHRRMEYNWGTFVISVYQGVSGLLRNPQALLRKAPSPGLLKPAPVILPAQT